MNNSSVNSDAATKCYAEVIQIESLHRVQMNFFCDMLNYLKMISRLLQNYFIWHH